jgi:hypothetical protein
LLASKRPRERLYVVARSVAEQIIAGVFARLPVGTLTAVGRRETAAHAAPPRVVAIPLGAPTIDLPNMPGDQRFTNVGRPLLLRRFDIEWHCHGAPDNGQDDFGPAERLYLATLVAIRTECHHSVVFSNEQWIDQQVNADGFLRHGNVITFTSTIDLPVYADRGVTVELTADPPIDTTKKLNDETVTG